MSLTVSRSRSFKDEYVFRAYALRREGMSYKKLGDFFNVGYETMKNWEKRFPWFRLALKMGREEWLESRKHRNEGELTDFVYNGLTPEMKTVWKKLSRVDTKKSGKQVIDAILEGKGKHFRQYLFLYAFIHGDFQITHACEKVGISVRVFQMWKKEKDFLRLFEEVNEKKKDLFESSLIKLVKRGHEAANIFVAKTQLKDRGYDDKARIDVNVNATLQTPAFPFEEIRPYLSTECQMELLEAMRKRRTMELETTERKQIESQVIETSFVERELEE